jgi:CheY-like chemotaxis protein
LQAYIGGRAAKNPAESWYEGEIGFFDFYIIPLAKKLKDCGVFGVSSDECLNYAKQNRKEWELNGKEVVAGMIESIRYKTSSKPPTPLVENKAQAPGSSAPLFAMSQNAPTNSLGKNEKANPVSSADEPVRGVSRKISESGLKALVQFRPTTVFGQESPVQELPEVLSVLVVDDDKILRKLFSRSVKKVAPKWEIQEAASGEIALELVAATPFHLIFMDQYMGDETHLLGSQTVAELRSKGVESRVCGLSANDVEQEFFDVGADAFMFKPFPCQKDPLTRELSRIMSTNPHGRDDIDPTEGSENQEAIVA